MGWWHSRQHPEDMLGDGPADALYLELQRLAVSGDVKPTFQDLIDGLAAALDDRARELVADPGVYRGAVAARFEPPATPLRSRPGAASPHLRTAIAEAVQAITAAYELELSRKPTLSEMLATVTFILAPHPEQYVSKAEGLRLAELSVAAS